MLELVALEGLTAREGAKALDIGQVAAGYACTELQNQLTSSSLESVEGGLEASS